MKRELVDFAGNDYLGLARDTRLAEAMTQAACSYGISATSSRWALGWTDLHQKLEEELAAFFGCEAACILGAAYLGGPVFYSTVYEPGKTAVCDSLSHSNQFLGMRGAGFTIRSYRHLDLEHLTEILSCRAEGPPLLATDGVFGISGEIAPLRELYALARARGGHLFVDDAHGVFVLGENGRGTPDHCRVPRQGVTLLGSLSKALGVNGGFLVSSRVLVEQFRRSPAASGSAIPPAPLVAACLEALRILQTEPERRIRLNLHARRMRQALSDQGIAVASTEGPVIALILKNEEQARAASEQFLAHGLRIPHFIYASEPRHNLLRAAARACYTEEDLQRFEEAVHSLPQQILKTSEKL